jgi:hypothetical protein
VRRLGRPSRISAVLRVDPVVRTGERVRNEGLAGRTCPVTCQGRNRARIGDGRAPRVEVERLGFHGLRDTARLATRGSMCNLRAPPQFISMTAWSQQVSGHLPTGSLLVPFRTGSPYRRGLTDSSSRQQGHNCASIDSGCLLPPPGSHIVTHISIDVGPRMGVVQDALAPKMRPEAFGRACGLQMRASRSTLCNLGEPGNAQGRGARLALGDGASASQGIRAVDIREFWPLSTPRPA